jgi:hypothetical protein
MNSAELVLSQYLVAASPARVGESGGGGGAAPQVYVGGEVEEGKRNNI